MRLIGIPVNYSFVLETYLSPKILPVFTKNCFLLFLEIKNITMSYDKLINYMYKIKPFPILRFINIFHIQLLRLCYKIFNANKGNTYSSLSVFLIFDRINIHVTLKKFIRPLLLKYANIFINKTSYWSVE